MAQSATTPTPGSAPVVTADELDKLRIDQLHAATLKPSDSCFEMKKMCATLLVATGTLVSVFSDKTLGRGVFVAGVAVVVAFWLADSVGYFYQRRLRVLMDGLIVQRVARSSIEYPFEPVEKKNGLQSAFNGSMWFYAILLVLIGLAWSAWEMGLFDGIAPTA